MLVCCWTTHDQVMLLLSVTTVAPVHVGGQWPAKAKEAIAFS